MKRFLFYVISDNNKKKKNSQNENAFQQIINEIVNSKW